MISHLTGDRSAAPPVVEYLAANWQMVRDVVTGAPATGMHWRRPTRECEDWCRKDHACTAKDGYPSGEHRSNTVLWTPPYGRLHITRVQRLDGRDYLSLGGSVRLHPDTRVAMSEFVHVPIAVDLAIRTAMAELEVLTPALDRPHRQVQGR